MKIQRSGTLNNATSTWRKDRPKRDRDNAQCVDNHAECSSRPGVCVHCRGVHLVVLGGFDAASGTTARPVSHSHPDRCYSCVGERAHCSSRGEKMAFSVLPPRSRRETKIPGRRGRHRATRTITNNNVNAKDKQKRTKQNYKALSVESTAWVLQSAGCACVCLSVCLCSLSVVGVHLVEDLLDDLVDEVLRDAADVLLDGLVDVLGRVVARLGDALDGGVDHSVHRVRRHHLPALRNLRPYRLQWRHTRRMQKFSAVRSNGLL